MLIAKGPVDCAGCEIEHDPLRYRAARARISVLLHRAASRRMSLDMASGMPTEMPANRLKSRESIDSRAEKFRVVGNFPDLTGATKLS
jgi:hypothetical protein